jgi:hypothetical protein
VLLLRVCFALLIALLVTNATAADSLGRVAEVRPEATAGLGQDRVLLVRGAELREGETVVTGLDGEVQVLFSDQTRLVIGRGSSLVIERYLLRSDGTPEKFAVNALAGTFRFITGKGDKNAYRIATPTGTIGIRGTEFDFTVERRSGRTSVVLFEGGVVLCPTAGECVTLTERCGVAQLVSRREAGLVEREADRAELAGTAFPYLASQSRLLREFRVTRPSQCAAPIPAVEKQQQRRIAATNPPPPEVPPEQPPPEQPPPEQPPPKAKGNNGLGNGGEGSEGPNEQGNPGKNKGKGNSKP